MNNVHLMSCEQLEKLQNLELKQDFLEAENNQMIKCIDDVEMSNRTLTGNILNLTKQIDNLNEDKKNLNLEINEKDVKLTNEVGRKMFPSCLCQLSVIMLTVSDPLRNKQTQQTNKKHQFTEQDIMPSSIITNSQSRILC